MPRGKKGPIPEEVTEPQNDPSAEQIVGEENVVDVDDPGPVPGEEPLPDPPGYKCSDPGCKFSSPSLSEIEEHCNGTGHGGFKTYQPELFSEPGVVHRNVEVPIAPEVLNEKRTKLAELYDQALDVKGKKKAADSAFNAELTAIDEDMQAINRILKTPYTYTNVDCEWKRIDEENARGLYRLDTGELLEKQPLTAEDMAGDNERANQANAQPAEQPQEQPAQV